VPLRAGIEGSVLSWTSLFAMGILVYLWVAEKMQMRVIVIWLFCAFGVHGEVVGWKSASVGLATALVVRFLPQMQCRRLVEVGLISYSLYLLHVPVGVRAVNITQRFEAHILLRSGAIIIVLVLSLVAAAVFYRWVEKPSHAWARRLRLRLGHQRRPSA